MIGSDILRHRPDWKVIDNPFAAPGSDPKEAQDPVVLLPALIPDVALFHAPYGSSDEPPAVIGRQHGEQEHSGSDRIVR